MAHYFKATFYFLLVCFVTLSCKKKITIQEDKIYSRHLQEHIKLTILSTPLPDNKSDMNLLLLNDGQDVLQLGAKEILDSLYSKKIISPLLIVAIHSDDRLQEYGVSGFPDYRNNGSRADKYAAFVDNELYDFVKKKAGVRKFKTISQPLPAWEVQ